MELIGFLIVCILGYSFFKGNPSDELSKEGKLVNTMKGDLEDINKNIAIAAKLQEELGAQIELLSKEQDVLTKEIKLVLAEERSRLADQRAWFNDQSSLFKEKQDELTSRIQFVNAELEKLQSGQFDNESKEFIEDIEELTKKLNQLTDEYVRNNNDYSNMVNQKSRQFRQPNSQLVSLNRKQRLLNKQWDEIDKKQNIINKINNNVERKLNRIERQQDKFDGAGNTDVSNTQEQFLTNEFYANLEKEKRVINPATGLPMVGLSLDSEGHLYGDSDYADTPDSFYVYNENDMDMLVEFHNQVDDIYDSGPHVENSVEDSDEHKNEDEDG